MLRFLELAKKKLGFAKKTKSKKAAKKLKRKKTLKKRIIKKANTKKAKNKSAEKKEKLVEIGKVTGYFRIPKAAVIRLKKGALKIGDEVLIKGHTTSLKQKISSLQVDRQPIKIAKKGVEFGLQVKKKVRRTDKVYLISKG